MFRSSPNSLSCPNITLDSLSRSISSHLNLNHPNPQSFIHFLSDPFFFSLLSLTIPNELVILHIRLLISFISILLGRPYPSCVGCCVFLHGSEVVCCQSDMWYWMGPPQVGLKVGRRQMAMWKRDKMGDGKHRRENYVLELQPFNGYLYWWDEGSVHTQHHSFGFVY